MGRSDLGRFRGIARDHIPAVGGNRLGLLSGGCEDFCVVEAEGRLTEGPPGSPEVDERAKRHDSERIAVAHCKIRTPPRSPGLRFRPQTAA